MRLAFIPTHIIPLLVLRRYSLIFRAAAVRHHYSPRASSRSGAMPREEWLPKMMLIFNLLRWYAELGKTVADDDEMASLFFTFRGDGVSHDGDRLRVRALPGGFSQYISSAFSLCRWARRIYSARISAPISRYAGAAYAFVLHFGWFLFFACFFVGTPTYDTKGRLSRFSNSCRYLLATLRLRRIPTRLSSFHVKSLLDSSLSIRAGDFLGIFRGTFRFAFFGVLLPSSVKNIRRLLLHFMSRLFSRVTNKYFQYFRGMASPYLACLGNLKMLLHLRFHICPLDDYRQICRTLITKLVK